MAVSPTLSTLVSIPVCLRRRAAGRRRGGRDLGGGLRLPDAAAGARDRPGRHLRRAQPARHPWRPGRPGALCARCWRRARKASHSCRSLPQTPLLSDSIAESLLARRAQKCHIFAALWFRTPLSAAASPESLLAMGMAVSRPRSLFLSDSALSGSITGWDLTVVLSVTWHWPVGSQHTSRRLSHTGTGGLDRHGWPVLLQLRPRPAG